MVFLKKHIRELLFESIYMCVCVYIYIDTILQAHVIFCNLSTLLKRIRLGMVKKREEGNRKKRKSGKQKWLALGRNQRLDHKLLPG